MEERQRNPGRVNFHTGYILSPEQLMDKGKRGDYTFYIEPKDQTQMRGGIIAENEHPEKSGPVRERISVRGWFGILQLILG